MPAVEPLLCARAEPMAAYDRLHDMMLKEVCARAMNAGEI